MNQRMNECMTFFPTLALCLCLTQQAGDSWPSLCPPPLHRADQSLRRTLHTEVPGPGLHPQCPHQIWTPVWWWGAGARIPGSSQGGHGACPRRYPPANPPNSTHSPRDHSALQEAPPQPQPSLPSLALECPQHREPVPQDSNLLPLFSLFPLTHLLGQRLLREYSSICSDGHYWRNKDWAQRHQAQNSHSS